MQIYSKRNNFYFSESILHENKNLLLFGLILFTFPLLPLNQLIVGAIVNALLIKSVISFKSNKVFLLSIIPSLAVFLGGVLFASITPQILLMLPAIWISNFVLMFLTRKLIVQNKRGYFSSTLVASILKTIILFSITLILFYFGLVPLIFLTMFGVMQFITAESGVVLVYLHKKIVVKNFK